MTTGFRFKGNNLFKAGFLFLCFVLIAPTQAQVKITFDYSTPSPFVMNIGEEAWVRFDVNFSDNNFTEIFLTIPDKPDFFTFWRERKFTGPVDYIYDKIIFKPTNGDGGQYFVKIVAGGVRPDGTVESDTLIYEVRVKPFMFNVPEYSGGTTNTITWMKSNILYDQWIYLIDPSNPGNAIPGKQNGLGKSNGSDIVNTTFENLQHGITYGYFIKGFTVDSAVTHSDTVYSFQDNDLPDFVDMSYGHEAPARAMNLWWQPVTDPTSYVQGYVIYRRKRQDPYMAIDTVFVDRNQTNGFVRYWDSPSDLQEGVKHYYKIAALDAGFNVGDGQEIGPFIPDETPPGDPTFHWEEGFGFDYMVDAPPPTGMGYEKTWYKKGKENQVFVFNPTGQFGFEGLARADSIRFQAVRDSSKFFEDEWQPGMQFFERWFSPWISVEDFAGQDLAYLFDFTSGGTNDDWFVHGHFFKFRAQYKDIAGNLGDWSRLNPDGLLVGGYQDVFSPSDISNLEIQVVFDPTRPGGGYFKLDWERSNDPVSGVEKFLIFRKIGDSGQFEQLGSVLPTAPLTFDDDFASIGQRKKTFYRISSVDNVGNMREVTKTDWEVFEWPPLPPTIEFEQSYLNLNNVLFTNQAIAGIKWPDFDGTDVAEMYVYINGDSLQVDPATGRFDTPLNEGENQIFAKALFANGVWSPMSNILNLTKDATPPTAVDLTVTNDTSFTGNISLNWTASQDGLPVCYEVLRRERGSLDFISLDTVFTTNYFDPYSQADGSVLKAFQYYEYKVIPKDTLGNMTEANAGTGTTYCNIAPKIKRFSFTTDSLSVFWDFPSVPDSNVVPQDSIRFDVKLFQDSLPDDFLTAPAYRVDYSIGGNFFKFKVEQGPTYFAVVRAVELISTNLDSSAWSYPRSSDTGNSIIPPVDSLLTQDQPFDTTGIFVSWEMYWDDPFWQTNPRDIVGQVKVYRWKEGDSQNKLVRVFKPGSDEFDQSRFLDKETLDADINYVYQVIPYEIKVNDPPRLLPAGNNDAFVVNDTSVVKNYSDRVFIPRLNHLYAVNPTTGKKYFTLTDPDDFLRIEWFWLYNKNGNDVNAKSGDFRGAERVKLFVSNNLEFANQPDFKKFTQEIELVKNNLASEDEFYFTNLFGLLDPATFNLYEGKSLFLKIMAFDRWGNDPGHPSSAEVDGVTEMILDNTPPGDPGISFSVKSSADTSANVTLVDIRFNWKTVGDNISGLRDYSIIVNKKDDPDSVILNIPDISSADTSFLYKSFEIKDEFFDFPLNFNIIPKDFAGNINTETKPVEFKFFNPPVITDGQRDKSTNNITLKWTKVPGADKYLVVFAVKKDYFNDSNLRNNPGNREEIIAKPTDPDTLTKKLSKYFNPDSSWYFRITAIKRDVFESGWSGFFLMETTTQSGNQSPITSVDNEIKTPKSFRLYQNYPNPFNPVTTIEYDIPRLSHVEISIVNLRGEKVRTVVSKEHEPGHFRAIWNGKNEFGDLVASGIYFYIISTPDFKQVEKCLLLK